MSRGRRRRGGAPRLAAGEGTASAPTPGTESPPPQAAPRKGGSRQKQTPQGGRPQAATPPGAEGARRSGGRRRRRRSGASRAEPSVLEQMANRPRVLQTLPADGLVAEEIIDDMREEYGYPATPQEYRLIVRIAPDDAERQGARRRREPSALPEGPAEATDEEAVDGDEASDAPKEAAPTVRRGRLRRRRRGRGRGGGAGRAEGAGPTAAGPRSDSASDSGQDSGQKPSPDSPRGSPGDSPGAAPDGGEAAAD